MGNVSSLKAGERVFTEQTTNEKQQRAVTVQIPESDWTCMEDYRGDPGKDLPCFVVICLAV